MKFTWLLQFLAGFFAYGIDKGAEAFSKSGECLHIVDKFLSDFIIQI
jgi:hypothetical protein